MCGGGPRHKDGVAGGATNRAQFGYFTASLDTRLKRLSQPPFVVLPPAALIFSAASFVRTDSAGFAVYGRGDSGHLKLTLHSTTRSLEDLAKTLSSSLGVSIKGTARDTHLVISFPSELEPEVRAWLARERPDVTIVSAGTRMEMYKEVGGGELPGLCVPLRHLASCGRGIGEPRRARLP
jgi:hypothetical protein